MNARILSWILIAISSLCYGGETDLVSLETEVISVSGANVELASVEGLEVGDTIIIVSEHGYGEAGVDGIFEIANLPNDYYGRVPIGKSAIRTVVDVLENIVTLDSSVCNDAVGLTCVRANDVAIVHHFENGIPFPPKMRLHCSMHRFAGIWANLQNGYQEYDGNGCSIIVPRGCPAMRLTFTNEDGSGPIQDKLIKNFTLIGNVKSSGYGYRSEGGVWRKGGSQPPAIMIGQDNRGIAKNIVLQNLIGIDNWRFIGTSLAEDCRIEYCTSILTDRLHAYVQWEFQPADSSRILVYQCNVDADYPRPGFNAFRSTDISFIACDARNASWAINTSGRTTIRDCTAVWDVDDANPDFWENRPIVDIGRYIEAQQGTPQENTYGGVTLENFTITYRKCPEPDKFYIPVLVARNYQTDPVPASIRNVKLELPYAANPVPMYTHTGYIVGSDDPRTLAEGIRVGPYQLDRFPIGIWDPPRTKYDYYYESTRNAPTRR